MKKVPIRKCLATHQCYPKEDLFRVVNSISEGVVLDMTGRLNGRGAYVHKDLLAIEKARKTKCLDRALNVKVPDEVYDRMIVFLKMK